MFVFLIVFLIILGSTTSSTKNKHFHHDDDDDVVVFSQLRQTLYSDPMNQIPNDGGSDKNSSLSFSDVSFCCCYCLFFCI